MANYHVHGFNISEALKKRLQKVMMENKPMTLNLKHPELTGNDNFYLTTAQVKRVNKALQAKRGARITLSKAQLEHNKKSGGFLAALLPFLAEMAPSLLGGLASSLLGYGATKAFDSISNKGSGLYAFGQSGGALTNTSRKKKYISPAVARAETPMKVPVNFLPGGIPEQASRDDYYGSGLFQFGTRK